MLVIDPDECIDCTLCVPECPVEAIFAEDDVPDHQKEFTLLNAELSKIWSPIIERKPAPTDADAWPNARPGLSLARGGAARHCGRARAGCTRLPGC